MIQDGIDPVLGAILPLIGVLIGATITVSWSAWQQRQQTVRDARMAARLTGDELYMFATHAITASTLKDWEPLNQWWASGIERVRRNDAQLAAVLTHDEWRLLQGTMRHVEITISVAHRRTGAPTPTQLDKLRSVATTALLCRTMLDEIAQFGLRSRKRRRERKRYLSMRVAFMENTTGRAQHDWLNNDEDGEDGEGHAA